MTKCFNTGFRSGKKCQWCVSHNGVNSIGYRSVAKELSDFVLLRDGQTQRQKLLPNNEGVLSKFMSVLNSIPSQVYACRGAKTP